QTAVAGAAVLVIGAAAVTVLARGGSPDDPPRPTSPPPPPVAAAPAGLTLTFTTEQRGDQGITYTAVVPHATGGDERITKVLDASLARPILGYVTRFAATNAATLAPLTGRTVLTTSARLVRRTDGYLSIRYGFTPAGTAAQHASWWQPQSAVFDLRTGKLLTASGIYRPQTLRKAGLGRVTALLNGTARTSDPLCATDLQIVDALALRTYLPMFTETGVRYEWGRCRPFAIAYERMRNVLRPEILKGFGD
ncbi:hypothetical protein, partial [Actinocorallia longicatena]|uniref:hypothetical protein n=1 Tax=Actinocorallia longicatena TaxID=111803 RepID=UPI0031DF0DA9